LRFEERGDHGVDEVLGLGLRVTKGIQFLMGGLLGELQEQFHCHPSGHWDIISVGGAMNLLHELLRSV
jgi:hypothetical protein